MVDFFSPDSRSAHYNSCFQKQTIFLLLDTQGIVLCTFDPGSKFLLSLHNQNCFQRQFQKNHCFDFQCFPKWQMLTVPSYLLFFGLALSFAIHSYKGQFPTFTRVDLGAMAMKGYSTFPKTPALLEPHHQIV